MPTKISELTTTTTLDGSELIPVVQGGVTKQTTVTDLVSGGELPAYSTSETLTTERWTNGKPIYSKVINHSFAGIGVWATSPVIATNIDEITSHDWVISEVGGQITGGEGQVGGSATTDYYTNQINANKELYVKAEHSSWANQPYHATVWYTKTTDTASSPVAGVTVTGGDSDWTTATYTSSWTDQIGTGVLQFRKTSDGTVHIRGFAKALDSANVVVFVLPVGYRPSDVVLFATASQNNQNVAIRIKANGDVTISNTFDGTALVAINTWASASCSFYAG